MYNGILYFPSDVLQICHFLFSLVLFNRFWHLTHFRKAQRHVAQLYLFLVFMSIFCVCWFHNCFWHLAHFRNALSRVVVIQFLSGVVPLTEMAGFTPFLLQLLALRPSTCLVSGHPPSSNQSSLSPLPLASSRSSSVVLAFSCHSLQDSD